MADARVTCSPLSSAAGRLRARGNLATVTLAEAALCAMYSLRLDPNEADLLDAAQQALALELPVTPNKSASAGGRAALWFGPDEWLLVIDAPAAAPLSRALAGRDASLVDVSDLRAIFELSGPRARDVLCKGCAIDVHPRVFRPGDCAVTAFARVRVALRQVDMKPTYELLVERSYAEYLWTWLEDAMVEYGTEC